MRRVLVLVGGVVVLVLAAAFSCAALRPPGGSATPEEAARRYFAAWGRGDNDGMRRLVDDPPADFAYQHRTLSKALHVQAVGFEPARPVRQGNTASVDYKVERELSGIGTWSFHAVLRLGRRHGRWWVRWSPATLYPSLADGGQLVLARLAAAPSAPVAADGKQLPADSSVQPYLADVADRFGPDDAGDPGWAVELWNPGRAAQRVKLLGGDHAKPVRTTLDRRLQTAADRAVGSAPAALVALRPSTGEIVAIADRLEEPKGALLGLNPPGSTFKVITGAAVLDGGMSPGASVACPAVTVAAQRTIHNAGDFALGSVPLTRAFAESCNTTFARLGVTAGTHRLADAAKAFGFGSHFDPGVAAYSGDFPKDAQGNALAEASIGQGKVQATTLDMAVVAAAVGDGTYRSPRLVVEHLVGHREARRLPAAVAGGLRSMMGAVVSYGTAAHAHLPAGTHGKTGTAEYGSAGHTHAWFIGYRGDLAFAVYVERGGEGGKVAAPIAARFLTVAKP
ncbi:MecA-like transpeptidase family protein [Actinoallomurus bryophytorum]|uniref:MecA-like transpeptidase family protein n=1 Tax=Actinoallomurus bryophytorum TaxID=1490222 RepID=A0A543CCI8_9ACTN|nr:penicillin-binding transpeptidase domain-containing protein [Actinoallomurus bryophytorum]TQL94808.1 MecA-like transpeptidase family protein [Actinoallomurus bryophytorum]